MGPPSGENSATLVPDQCLRSQEWIPGGRGGGWAIHPTHIPTPPPNPSHPWESCPEAFLRLPAAHSRINGGCPGYRRGGSLQQKTLSRTALRFPQSLKSRCFASWPPVGKCVFLQRVLARKSPLACWVPGGRCRNTKAARTPRPKPVTAFSLLHSWEGN